MKLANLVVILQELDNSGLSELDVIISIGAQRVPVDNVLHALVSREVIIYAPSPDDDCIPIYDAADLIA